MWLVNYRQAVPFIGLLDIDYSTAVIAVTVVTIVYVTLGGLFADVYTSIGQTCLMMFAGVIVFLSGFFFFRAALRSQYDHCCA
ncbi:MAG: sodium:solute symporter family transporter [Phascolarctobacterium faecium]